MSNLCQGCNRPVGVRVFFSRIETKPTDSLSICFFPDTTEA